MALVRTWVRFPPPPPNIRAIWEICRVSGSFASLKADEIRARPVSVFGMRRVPQIFLFFLDRIATSWYNVYVHIKATLPYILAFCLGIIAHAYAFPAPRPIDIDDMNMEKISWILLDKLEAEGYNITRAKQELTQPKRGWFDW